MNLIVYRDTIILIFQKLYTKREFNLTLNYEGDINKNNLFKLILADIEIKINLNSININYSNNNISHQKNCNNLNQINKMENVNDSKKNLRLKK